MLSRRDIERRGAVLWCVGLPLTDERRLEREEQRRLRHSAWRLFVMGLASFLVVAVGGVGLIVLTAAVGGSSDGPLIVITLLVVTMLLGLPASLFARESWTQRGWLLFRDLRQGHVLVFEGTLTEADLLKNEEEVDAAQQRLVTLGLLTLDRDHPQRVEVLPVSRQVWRVGGDDARPWVEVCWKEVSGAPESAIPWLHRTDAAGEERCRYLSDGEQAELFREARRHWLRPFVPALLLTVWLSAIVALVLTERHIPKSADWGGAFHLALAALAADVFFVVRVRQARQMYADARGGEVLVETDSACADGSGAVSFSETLPHSGRRWTTAGRPAAWRRIGR